MNKEQVEKKAENQSDEQSLFGRNMVKKGLLYILAMALGSEFVYGMNWKQCCILIFISITLVVPWKVKKWFLLVLGIAILSTTVWVLLPEQTDGQWMVNKLDGCDNSSPQTSNETVAGSYFDESVIMKTDWVTFYRDINKNDPNMYYERNAWTSNDNPELSLLINQYQSELAALLELSKIKPFQIDIHPGLGAVNQRSRIVYNMIMCTKLLRLSAARDCGTGDLEAAYDKYYALVCIGDSFVRQYEPNLFELGLAAKASGYGGVRRMMQEQEVDLDFVNRFERILEDNPYDLNQQWKGYLSSRKAFTDDLLKRQYYINKSGECRFNLNALKGSGNYLNLSESQSSYCNGLESRAGALVDDANNTEFRVFLLSDFPGILKQSEDIFDC